MPREDKFFDLFEVQAANNVTAAKLFFDMVQSWSLEPERFRRLQEIEHESDITTHEVYDKLNRSFITPFDREDIHELASELDDVVDLVQSIATRMQLFHIEKTTPELVALSETLWNATEAVLKAVTGLRDPGKTRRVLDYCIEINRLENAGDRLLENAIGKLFHGTPDALQVIKWKEIYEGIEIAIDKCEDVANIIESILVKQA
ncbi:MAG: DUF47 domain-containing protein [Elusimicrobia bacterium]|nr:DUF47 domain-containing protein [Elusimicrobiota bacterium]